MKLAATPEELSRLRAALSTGGEKADVVGKIVTRADQALKRTISFPPEGGHHNQWYQCEPCQLGLEALDETRHQCPKCSRVYSGYPYDNVLYTARLQALTRDMHDCGWAFALTRDKLYAMKARDILMGFSRRYNEYPLHSLNQGTREDPLEASCGHVFEQTLNEAVWAHPVVETFDLIRTSSVLSATEDASIRRFLCDLAGNIWKHKAGRSNWQTYHNSAFILIGGILGDEALIERALHDPENGHVHQLDVSLLPGGMWYENSWSYHFYALAAVERVLETARRLGIDLYADPRIKSMYTVALDFVMVDGTLPRFGDALTTEPPAERYETAFHAWRDLRFLQVLPDRPSWFSILLGRGERSESASRCLPRNQGKQGSGHAILRMSGSPGPSSAVVCFGSFGGFHGHFDKLSFVYFAMGKELAYDPGRARSQAYRLPIHQDWYRATTSHNTVMVDRQSQEGTEGIAEFFGHHEELSVFVGRLDSAYQGVTHRRLILLRAGHLIVADVLEDDSGASHTYDWLYHNRGESIRLDGPIEEGLAPRGQGFEYLRDIRRARTDQGIRATVEMATDAVDVVVNAQAGSEVLVATGVGESVLDRVPLMMVTRTGACACFGAVIEPRENRLDAQLGEVTVTCESGRITLEVVHKDQRREIYDYSVDPGARTLGSLDTSSRFVALACTPEGKRTLLCEL